MSKLHEMFKRKTASYIFSGLALFASGCASIPSLTNEPAPTGLYENNDGSGFLYYKPIAGTGYSVVAESKDQDAAKNLADNFLTEIISYYRTGNFSLSDLVEGAGTDKVLTREEVDRVLESKNTNAETIQSK